jgi:hypothetical protein
MLHLGMAYLGIASALGNLGAWRVFGFRHLEGKGKGICGIGFGLHVR